MDPSRPKNDFEKMSFKVQLYFMSSSTIQTMITVDSNYGNDKKRSFLKSYRTIEVVFAAFSPLTVGLSAGRSLSVAASSSMLRLALRIGRTDPAVEFLSEWQLKSRVQSFLGRLSFVEIQDCGRSRNFYNSSA